MRNERFAVRQKLAEAYRSQLSASQARLEQYWTQTAAELQDLAQTTPASAAFAKCIQSKDVDSLIIYDQQGHILYPNAPSAFQTNSSEPERKWAEASKFEYQRNDFIAAAKLYDALAKEATNANVAARAFQAQARCLVRAEQNDAAIRVIDETLGGERYRRAADPQGRLIVANAELMALELTRDRASPVFQSIAQRLQQRLLDYENQVLAAPQRRFLMKELQKLSPKIRFPMLAAEALAAQFSEHSPTVAEDSALHRSPLADVWQFATADRRVVALLRSDRLLARLQALANSDNLPADAEITLAPPETDTATAFVSLQAGSRLPGWRLALSLKDRKLFESTTEHRSAVYLWTGILMVGAMGVLALLAAQFVRRQMALARLKNDLAATVSHELKTPLSSMRVLVDTLLDSEKLNEQTVREYLQLIAQENERLSRLIENFLTFSRMERKKYTFHFKPLPAQQIIDATVQAVRERFDARDCRFEIQAENDLPCLVGDPDALTTALINLLDNAHKYSGEIKHVTLRARAENGNVVFSVSDNGVGIAPRETKRVFQRFYQVGQPLTNLTNEIANPGHPLVGQVVSPRLQQPEQWQTNAGWSHELASSTVVSAGTSSATRQQEPRNSTCATVAEIPPA